MSQPPTNHADLIARADEQLAKSHPWLAQGYVPIIRDLRDALVLSEGALIFAKRALAEANAKPVLPDAVRAVLEDNIAEYSNAEIEAFLAAHQPLEDETK